LERKLHHAINMLKAQLRIMTSVHKMTAPADDMLALVQNLKEALAAAQPPEEGGNE
jgi:hypothetical protein